MSKDIERLVVLGPAATYLDVLAGAMDHGVPVEFGRDFVEMIAQAENSPETAILLPIKNTLKGTLYDVVGAFQSGRLAVVGAAQLDVVSHIMGIGTLEDAVAIGGKDVSLEQITGFMPHLERRPMSSTAAAGQLIQQTGDKTLLSVGAKAQVPTYGLDLLAEAVQDPGLNETSVLVVRGRNGWIFDPDALDPDANLSGTMIISPEDSAKSGALEKVSGALADRDINLEEIESLTVRGTRRTEFFLTFVALGSAIIDLATSGDVKKHMGLDILGTYYKPPETYKS